MSDSADESNSTAATVDDDTTEEDQSSSSSSSVDSSSAPLVSRLGETAVGLLSGSVAAICGSYVKQPIQRLKWLRQVSEAGTTLEKQSLLYTLRCIVQNEGFFAGLWRGSIATITRNIPHAALVYTAFPMYYDMLLNDERSPFARVQTDQRNLPLIRSCAGAMSSFSVTLMTHPLDTLRVRIATQYAAASDNSLPYPSLIRGIRSIYSAEGLSAFYRGLNVSLMGTMLRGGIGFGVYETLKSEEYFDLANQRPRSEPRKEDSLLNDASKRVLCGLMAGMSTTTLCQPIDTVRRRQQVYSSKRVVSESEMTSLGGRFGQSSHSMVSSVGFIWKNEGMAGFYKGLSLGLIKSPLAIGVSFAVNDLVKLLFGVKLSH